MFAPSSCFSHRINDASERNTEQDAQN
uniref:Uncharacterized protein n=1 Tax=Arundo donax TaxID=35708 RepID=A0A0A9ELD8_ARUDO